MRRQRKGVFFVALIKHFSVVKAVGGALPRNVHLGIMIHQNLSGVCRERAGPDHIGSARTGGVRMRIIPVDKVQDPIRKRREIPVEAADVLRVDVFERAGCFQPIPEKVEIGLFLCPGEFPPVPDDLLPYLDHAVLIGIDRDIADRARDP